MTTRQTIGIFFLCLSLPSCTHWVQYTEPPTTRGTVRVTLVSGSRHDLINSRVEGDYFRGQFKDHPYTAPFTAPVDGIRSFETLEVDEGKTAVLIAGFGLGVVWVAYYIANSLDFGLDGVDCFPCE